MELLTKISSLANLTTDLLVLPVQASDLALKNSKKNPRKFSATAKDSEITFASLDEFFEGALSKILLKASFKCDKTGNCFFFTLQHPRISSLLIYSVDGVSNQKDTFQSHDSYRKLGTSIHQHAKKIAANNACIYTKNLDLKNETKAIALLEGILLSGYEYSEYKSTDKDKNSSKTSFALFTLGKNPIEKKFFEKALILSECTTLARDLVNMAPNHCTPDHLANVAKNLSKQSNLTCEIFNKSKLEKMGANALLAVNKGSDLPAYILKLTYSPRNKNKKTKVISLVGKGVTFDTGGYSLKPPDGMIGMKCDMAGAACVLGTMKAIAQLKPNCEVRGYIPTTENMVNGSATRVGDIVTAMNGTTVEILNTDAEGRLILADALTLSERDKADVTIDIATLTGACMVALGTDYAGVFSDDKKLSDSIIQNGNLAGERFWPLPLSPEYEDSIKSKIADIKNIGGGRWGGAITAALFLKRFVKDTRWAHLDIAGPAESDSDKGYIKAGGVGFGVRTLTRLIQNFK